MISKYDFDNIIDINSENEKNIKYLIHVLEKTAYLYNQMKELTILLDNEMTHLKTELQIQEPSSLVTTWGLPLPGTETVKVPNASLITKYNTLIQQYLNDISSLLKERLPSCNGLSNNIIKQWSSTSEVNIMKLNLKMTGYNWVNCVSNCIIDNMLIDIPPVYSTVYKNVYAPISTPYSITKNLLNYVYDGYILLRTATLTLTINLPNAPLQGTRIVLKDHDSNAAVNNVTILPGGGDTVNGLPADIINVNGQSVEYIYTGTDWIRTNIIGNIVLLSATDNIIKLDTVTIGYTLHLPVSPSNGTVLLFQDISGNSAINIITINGNTATVEGLPFQIIDSDYAQYSIKYLGNKWIYYPITSTNYPYVNGDVYVDIHVGQTVVQMPFVTNIELIQLNAYLRGDSKARYDNFSKLLCESLPLVLHMLNALYNKNVKNIDTCLNRLRSM